VPAGRRSDPKPEATAAATAPLAAELPWLALLFAAALWTIVRTMGTSPAVWIDTLIENIFIDDCLTRNQCTMVGAGATFGIFHSAGYLHWRALLYWLGLDANGTYVILLTTNALGVALAALAARRLESRVAAAVAALLMLGSIGVPVQLNVITDVAPLPFLGAVFLLVALAAHSQDSLGMTAVMGLVGAVIANVYITGVLCGVSAVWIALLSPRRRRTHAAVAATAFGVATFLISPGTWILDASLLLSHAGLGNATSKNPFGVLDYRLARLTALATLCWAGAAASGRLELRRKLDVPFAIFLPLFVPLAIGNWTGRLDAQEKYLAHVIAAVTVGVAVPLVRGAGWLWRWLEHHDARAADLHFGTTAVERFSPYAAAALIVIGSLPQHGVQDFTFRDLQSVKHVLAEQRGWAWPRVSRNLKTLDDVVRRATLRWPRGWPQTGTENDLERAYLLKVPVRRVPEPLPPTLVVAHSTDAYATLLGFACSWIDWRSFRVCVQTDGAAERCAASGLPTVADPHADDGAAPPGMPVVDVRNPPRQIMTLHLPLQPRQQCPEEWVYMPRLYRMCPGRIVGVDGDSSGIDPSGRWAKLKLQPTAAGPAPQELSIAFELGGRDCWSDYRGYPPFFVEGDPAAVAPIAALLEQQAAREGYRP